MNKYYQILDLTENATVDEIRKAYRSKAKEFHPDKNKTPGAQEKFILVNQAYEYLINLKEGKITSSGDAQIDDFARWWRREEARVREDAHRKSQMRYRKYVRTEKILSEAEEEQADVTVVVFAVAIIIFTPVILSIWKGWTGFWVSLIIIALTFYFSESSLKTIRTISYTRFFKLVKDIVTANWFFAIFITIINLMGFFNAGFKTLIPVKTLVMCYTVAAGVAYLTAIILKLDNKRRHFISFALVPLAITFLLLVNFWVSFNPVDEVYYYNLEREARYKNGRTYYKTTSLMRLENNKYDEYFGLRVFVDINEVMRGNRVTFTFREGILGFRVLKEYKLERVPEPTSETDTIINW